MALKPTIFKASINISDLNRDYYGAHNLTIAQHPSESLERMVARTIAFCIHAEEHLSFTRGLSCPEEPDIWLKTLDDQMALWIDVGEPAFDRIKKACRTTKALKVYSFNTKSDVWWRQEKEKFNGLPVEVFQFDRSGIKALAALVTRTMDLSITLSGDTAYIAAEGGECELSWKLLS